MRLPWFRARSLVLAGALFIALTQTACLPDKPMEDPTPVGGRPTPTRPAVTSPVAGSSPAAGAVASPAAASAGGATGKVGEAIRGDTLTLTINKVDRTATSLVLNITVANSGPNDVLVQPAVELVVQYGPTGTESTAAPSTFNVPQPRFVNDVKRGASSTGNVAYNVPQTAANLWVTWKAPQTLGGRVLAVVELPAS